MSASATKASSSSAPVTFTKPPATGIVIFGASGDLTKKKLIPAIYNLFRDRLLPEKFFVVGASRTKMSHAEFHANLKPALQQNSRTALDEQVWTEFVKHVYYISVDATKPEDYGQLKKFVEELEGSERHNYLFYLSAAPEFFGVISSNLKASSLVISPTPGERRSAVIVEKPFGHDLDSARTLNVQLRQSLAEEQIFRIDHYLGKETVQNILVFRFANGIFEPLWNYRYIDNIQISVCEDIGVGKRAGYFDNAGIMRDIVQNHLLQVLALLCIEPPISLRDPTSIRDEKVKVIRSLRPLSSEDVYTQVIRGQYSAGTMTSEKGGSEKVPGYLQEPGVAPNSATETFVALRLEIDNWRWSGVPIYVRAGKRMPKRVTEVTIFFKRGPESMFQGVQSQVEQNTLTIRIQPNEGISICVNSKPPGTKLQTKPVNLDFSYGDVFEGPSPEAYERLLLDAMKGDSTLFIRDDEIEAAWAFLEPVFEAWRSAEPPALYPYAPGSAGPDVANKIMISPMHKWHGIF